MIRWWVVTAGLMCGGLDIKEARNEVDANGTQVKASWSRLELLTVGGPERYVHHREHNKPPPKQ